MSVSAECGIMGEWNEVVDGKVKESECAQSVMW